MGGGRRRKRQLVLSLTPTPLSLVSLLAVYVGPTTESNWVILDRLLVGAYPGVNDDDDNMSLLWSILTQKITTFCCLQVEYPDPSVTEEMWRSGKAIRPYYKDAVDIVSHVDQMRAVAEPGHVAQYSNVTTSSKLDFVHVPIVDCSVTDDTTIIKLCKDLVARLAKVRLDEERRTEG